MLDSEVLLPVVGNALVESGVLFLCDVCGVSCPYGLLFVEEDPFVCDFLDLLLFLLL
jgi:hypothetical protein